MFGLKGDIKTGLDSTTNEAGSSSQEPLINLDSSDAHDGAGPSSSTMGAASPIEDLPTYSELPPPEDPAELPPPFSIYRPEFETDPKTSVITSHDPHLNTDGEALYRFLMEQNTIFPTYACVIKGSHTEEEISWEYRNGKNHETRSSRTVVDFEFKIDMTFGVWNLTQGNLEVVPPGESVYRGGRFKDSGVVRSEATGHLVYSQLAAGEHVDGGIGLETVRDICYRYCKDKSTLKEFVMTKTTPGYNHERLRAVFQDAVRSTGYIGDLDISFVWTRHKVIIQPDNRISRLRTTWYVRWFFYITFLFLITWPILFLTTKKYHLIRSVWPTYKSEWVESEGTYRKMFKISEEKWGSEWWDAVRWAAMSGRKGGLWLSEEDRQRVSRENLAQDNYRRDGGRYRRSRSWRDGWRGTLGGSGVGNVLGMAAVARNLLEVDETAQWGGDVRV
ncbi:hypothetical protein BJ508DRAFT_411234 [Ascobolus immersus RN42]|uniref:Uncharacterized protein n=1 Tax=Ascobolus immersus RN42 TaxID=1160509 RepID=A0A3N4IP90_ASCIM|nr:hypothetical protein BJ508DRAFT_411234 [Ascobolus immersus RN42]